MLHGDTILQASGACDLLTGQRQMRHDFLTGLEVPWTWLRSYGCNTPVASENLLTFRSGAAGYFDLANDGGTGNFGGFRSSCTNNLIVAGGLLNAPDYTRTCTCSYQNQSSLALVPMADAEMWTYFGTTNSKAPIERVGINLGAPGDRRSADGTLWLAHPRFGGKSPNVNVSIAGGKPEWFRHYSGTVEREGLNWVASSGVKGLTSLSVTLGEQNAPVRAFTVRLHFLEPDGLKPGERLFNVWLQGNEVLHELDIAKEAGGANRALVKEFHSIEAGDKVTVTFTPATTAPGSAAVLCGIEIVAEP